MSGETIYLEWVSEVMLRRPKQNMYLDSKRGMEIGQLCLDFEKQNFTWKRSDVDTFWVDVQLFTKYKLSDDEILFVMNQQPGINNYAKHSEERKAYAEFMRGLEKLRAIEAGMSYSEWSHKQKEASK